GGAALAVGATAWAQRGPGEARGAEGARHPKAALRHECETRGTEERLGPEENAAMPATGAACGDRFVHQRNTKAGGLLAWIDGERPEEIEGRAGFDAPYAANAGDLAVLVQRDAS